MSKDFGGKHRVRRSVFGWVTEVVFPSKCYSVLITMLNCMFWLFSRITIFIFSLHRVILKQAAKHIGDLEIFDT